MPITVTASDARAQFPTIAKRVHDEELEVTVFKGSKPYVKIVPIGAGQQKKDEQEEEEFFMKTQSEEVKERQIKVAMDFMDEYADVFEKLAR